MWVNFSLSENEFLQFRSEAQSGKLKMPKDGGLEIDIVLADGSQYAKHGRISFSDAALNSETGTYLVRAEFANPDDVLRPGQFVRVKVRGASLSSTLSVPQEAVQQGDRGAFVWTVDEQGKAKQRAVETGGWNGSEWVINSGLRPGDRVIVENLVKLAPDMPVNPHPFTPSPAPATAKATPSGGAQ
jgi:membrane fusion protein, multidrug efflux system